MYLAGMLPESVETTPGTMHSLSHACMNTAWFDIWCIGTRAHIL